MSESNLFNNSPASVETKLNNFTKYISQRKFARFMAHLELFKLQLDVKGSIIDCGVFHGGSLFTWAKISTILEPFNYHRKIIGFDTFEGFPSIDKIDEVLDVATVGGLNPGYDSFLELNECISVYDSSRPLNHIEKIKVNKGNVMDTIPKFLEENQWLVCSMLYLDFDLYEPTKVAIKHFLPRMPKGAVIAFDELGNANWPGETQAVFESIGLSKLEIKNFPYEPNISYAVIQ